MIGSAALARHIYLRKGVGVGALKKAFGGRASRGSRPHHHADASGSVIRKALQSLEKLKVLEKDPSGGRQLTKNGQKDLDRYDYFYLIIGVYLVSIAAQVLKAQSA